MSVQDEFPPPLDLPPEPSTDPPSSAGWKSWAIAAAVAVAMVVGGVVVVSQLGGDDSDAQANVSGTTDQSTDSGDDASGAAAQGFGSGVFGTLVEIGNDGFVVEGTDRSGETTSTSVTVTDDTTFTESQEGDLQSIQVGDNVVVTGEAGADGSVSATAIVDNGGLEVAFGGGNGGAPPDGFQPPDGGELPEGFQPPEGFEPPDGGELPDDFQPPEGFEPPEGGGPGGFGGARTIGQVTAVDGSTLTVETADGETVTVTVGSDTEVTVTVEASRADLEVGDDVQVTATVDGDAIVAESVRIGAVGFGGFGAGGAPR